MSSNLIIKNSEAIPDVHYTQRNLPLSLEIRYIGKSHFPAVVQLGVDTLPRVEGKKVNLTPENVFLDLNDDEWTVIHVQPQQLSYHVGCDLKLEFFAIDPETKQRVKTVNPFVTKAITLKSKSSAGSNDKKCHPKGEIEDLKTKEENLKLWVKASVEFMKLASQKGEHEIEETPIQQLLVKQYMDLNI